MRTAAKVVVILGIIGAILTLLLFGAAQTLTKEAFQQMYDNGEFYVNDHLATEEDLEVVLQAIPVVFGALMVVLFIYIAFKLVNLFVLFKGYKTGILIFGIISLFFGGLLSGIFQILDYALAGRENVNFDSSVTF